MARNLTYLCLEENNERDPILSQTIKAAPGPDIGSPIRPDYNEVSSLFSSAGAASFFIHSNL